LRVGFRGCAGLQSSANAQRQTGPPQASARE
jgi:hypothetical protein